MGDDDSEAHQHYLDAKAKYEAGDYQGSLAALELTLDAPDMRDEYRPDIWLYRAFCWLHLGEWALADDAAAQAGDANQAAYIEKRAALGGGVSPPGESDSVSHQWYVHGKAQYDAGDYQGAVASFESAMNAGDMPEHARAGLHLVHALCLLHLGAFDRADELAAGLPADERAAYDGKRREVLTNTVAHQWYLYGRSQYDNHDYDGALASFDESLAAPDCTEDVKSGINLMRAMCHLRSGRIDQADETAQLLAADERAAYDAKRHELLETR